MTDAERLATAWFAVVNPGEQWYGSDAPLESRYLAAAQRAIDAGWTPPDPHEEIARELMTALFPAGFNWPPEPGYAKELLDAVRRLDLRRGDA